MLPCQGHLPFRPFVGTPYTLACCIFSDGPRKEVVRLSQYRDGLTVYDGTKSELVLFSSTRLLREWLCIQIVLGMGCVCTHSKAEECAGWYPCVEVWRSLWHVPSAS